jgi:hypothetical protein
VEKLSWISLTFVRQHVADPVNQNVKEYLLRYKKLKVKTMFAEGLEKPTGWICALNLYTILKQIAEQVYILTINIVFIVCIFYLL